MVNLTESNKSGNSRDRIMQSAIHLFAHQGFDRTGLRELTKNAQVNLSMIKYFFGSKKNLLTEILDTFFSSYLDIATKTLTGEGSLQSKITNFITNSISFFDSNESSLLVAVTEIHRDDPDIIELKASWGRHMLQIIENEVCLPLEKLTGRKFDPKLIAPLMTSMMSSRFLFSPVMDQIKAYTAKQADIIEYSQTITNLFLFGIFDSEDQPEQNNHNLSDFVQHI